MLGHCVTAYLKCIFQDGIRILEPGQEDVDLISLNVHLKKNLIRMGQAAGECGDGEKNAERGSDWGAKKNLKKNLSMGKLCFCKCLALTTP